MVLTDFVCFLELGNGLSTTDGTGITTPGPKTPHKPLDYNRLPPVSSDLRSAAHGKHTKMPLKTIQILLASLLLSHTVPALANPIIAADPLNPVVHRGSIAFVAVAMGGETMEGERPKTSGIVYDPAGNMYRLQRKPLRKDWGHYLAWQIRPNAPLGTWTIYATVERDSRAWGTPTTITVVP